MSAPAQQRWGQRGRRWHGWAAGAACTPRGGPWQRTQLTYPADPSNRQLAEPGQNYNWAQTRQWQAAGKGKAAVAVIGCSERATHPCKSASLPGHRRRAGIPPRCICRRDGAHGSRMAWEGVASPSLGGGPPMPAWERMPAAAACPVHLPDRPACLFLGALKPFTMLACTSLSASTALQARASRRRAAHCGGRAWDTGWLRPAL